MKKKLIIGVIGCGRIGRLHIENISNHIHFVTIKAIADLYANEIKAWAYELGINNVYSDYKKILNDTEIDAVLICSPTDTHSKIIVEAAKAGKNIFCEKPIDFDIENITFALDAVRQSGVKLQIGFNRRYDHNFKAVKDKIAEGKIGDLHIIKITSRDPAPPPIEYIKVSGGIFLDMTIHDFDMVRYLTGGEVTEVYTNAAVLVDPAIGAAGDVDTAIISLKFANGAIGVIDNSRKAVYGYDQQVEVFGLKGSIAISNDTPNSSVLSTEEGVFCEKPKHFFLERYKDSFVAELKDFFEAVCEDRETSVTGIDGLKPVQIGLAAQKSYITNMPVKILT
ncbi:MAG: inositol 2-dehydrogenase [Eubacteriales bacterium]|nr:inositol 2-dehydrogenase [Eubacteriales bacterium]